MIGVSESILFIRRKETHFARYEKNNCFVQDTGKTPPSSSSSSMTFRCHVNVHSGSEKAAPPPRSQQRKSRTNCSLLRIHRMYSSVASVQRQWQRPRYCSSVINAAIDDHGLFSYYYYFFSSGSSKMPSISNRRLASSRAHVCILARRTN